RGDEALGLYREALRHGRLDAEGVDRAGRAIQREFRAQNGALRPVRVLMLGQCTTSWLATALTAVAWGHDVPTRVDEGEYDGIMQELMARSPSTDDRPD